MGPGCLDGGYIHDSLYLHSSKHLELYSVHSCCFVRAMMGNAEDKYNYIKLSHVCGRYCENVENGGRSFSSRFELVRKRKRV